MHTQPKTCHHNDNKNDGPYDTHTGRTRAIKIPQNYVIILVMLFVCMGMLGHPNGTKPDHAAAIIPAHKPTHQLKIHCEDSEIQNRLFGCKLIVSWPVFGLPEYWLTDYAAK